MSSSLYIIVANANDVASAIAEAQAYFSGDGDGRWIKSGYVIDPEDVIHCMDAYSRPSENDLARFGSRADVENYYNNLIRKAPEVIKSCVDAINVELEKVDIVWGCITDLSIKASLYTMLNKMKEFRVGDSWIDEYYSAFITPVLEAGYPQEGTKPYIVVAWVGC